MQEMVLFCYSYTSLEGTNVSQKLIYAFVIWCYGIIFVKCRFVIRDRINETISFQLGFILCIREVCSHETKSNTTSERSPFYVERVMFIYDVLADKRKPATKINKLYFMERNGLLQNIQRAISDIYVVFSPIVLLLIARIFNSTNLIFAFCITN